jgi:hypothetical protein
VTRSVARSAALALVLFPMLSPSRASAAPKAAEYAIRWNIAEGGPKTIETTLDVLSLKGAASDQYEVQYFSFTPPKDAPSGFTAILRQRRKGKKFELTFKYRGDRTLATWTCPLSPTPSEQKQEVDVSILGSEVSRAHSLSCTVESKSAPVVPPEGLAARPMTCTSKVTRVKAGDVKLEKWQFPGDITIIEVSQKGDDSPADLKKFQDDLATPLIKGGIRPSAWSKTESGSSCQ